MNIKKYNRIFVVVVDSLGVGEMPDALEYGDAGTDTLGHISQSVDSFHIPNLQKLGVANLHELKQVPAVDSPLGYYTKLREASKGKDTMTGHWEMMGLHITKPFKTFTENGFPKELLDELFKEVAVKNDYSPETYDLAYMSDKQLIELNLAKEVLVEE